MSRTPPVRTATPTVDINPQRRKLQPSGSVDAPRSGTSAAPPRVRAAVAAIEASASHRRYGDPQVTVEARWYPPGLAAGSTAAPLAGEWRATNDDAEAAVAGGAGAADRRCAVVTMVVAASLAVAVSVVV